MFEGVALIVLGVLAIAAPFFATIAVEIYIGWLFLIAGIVGLVAMFYADDIAAFLWTLVTAALSLCLGVLLLYKPAAGAVTLTLALTAFFVAEGVFQIVTSIAYRKVLPGAWGWLLASGRLRSDPGRDHCLQLAAERRVDAGSAGRRQSPHLGLGDRHDRVRRARCGQVCRSGLQVTTGEDCPPVASQCRRFLASRLGRRSLSIAACVDATPGRDDDERQPNFSDS